MVVTPGNKLGSIERDSDMGHEMFINIWLEQILNSLFPLKGSMYRCQNTRMSKELYSPENGSAAGWGNMGWWGGKV